MKDPVLPPPVDAAARPPAPAFAEAAGQVMARQIQASLRGRRFLAAALLVALAPVLAVAMRNPDPVSLTRVVVQLVLPFLLPLVAITLGSGLLQEEAEEGTLTYLFTAPVDKSAVVLGKWAAALASGWGLALASLGATFLLTPVDLGPHGPFVRASIFAVLLGYPAYLGLFTLMGTIFRRGYLAGLIYAFGYEMVVGFVPGAAKRLSLGFFLRSLVRPHVEDDAPFEGAFLGLDPDPETVCLVVLLSVTLVTLAVTLTLVPRKEFRTRNVQG